MQHGCRGIFAIDKEQTEGWGLSCFPIYMAQKFWWDFVVGGGFICIYIYIFSCRDFTGICVNPV